MKVSYLLLVHDKADQFGRLMRALDHEGASAVVHVDKRADSEPFAVAAAVTRVPTIFVDDRFDIKWGNFAAVSAELALLRTATTQQPADYYILLSGADYPIRPSTELFAELASGAVYMTSWPMPNKERGKTLESLQYFHFAAKNRRNRIVHYANCALRRLPPRDVRTHLDGRRPYGGAQWWALPHSCAQDILEFAERQPHLVRFYRWTRNPDEMFFQTVVNNLEDRNYDIRDSLTFTDWSRHGRHQASPATLTAADVPALMQSRLYFARKFDSRLDSTVLDLIDERLSDHRDAGVKAPAGLAEQGRHLALKQLSPSSRTVESPSAP